jgi:hypothetical protein
LSDHPNPGNRTEYLNKEISSYPPKPNLMTSSPAFDRIKQQVAVMHAYTAKEVSSGIWRTQNPNQTVGSGVNESAGPTAGTVAPDLDTSGSWKTFRGTGFSLDIPGEWKAYGNQISAMVGPSGGIVRMADGRAGVVYGVLTNTYQPRSGVHGAVALDSLISEIAGNNPGFQASRQQTIAVNGLAARSVECDNPSANGGRGEHDWLVSFEQSDGSLRYFAFVAPMRDFERLRPAFWRMLQSVRIPG